MHRITVSRHPRLYFASLLLVALAHLFLSHYAATSRGYPPPNPFWQHVAPWLPFFGVALPPVFEDWKNNPSRRKRLLVGYSCWGSFILGIVSANVRSGRPSIGHLTGFVGVVSHCLFVVLFCAVGWSMIVVPFVFCFESVARGIWDLVGSFPDSGTSAGNQ